MRVRYVAEYDGGVRVDCDPGMRIMEADDESDAYRCARRRLEMRPTAHRVEAWSGSRYVTRATRGVETAHRSDACTTGDDPCFASCCMPTSKEDSE